MMKLSNGVNWKEVFKFLSGATFVGAIGNGYLYWTHVSVPFLGYAISPGLLGLRAMVHFALFLTFFYFGYLKKQ